MNRCVRACQRAPVLRAPCHVRFAPVHALRTPCPATRFYSDQVSQKSVGNGPEELPGVASSVTLNEITGRPVPINVEMAHYKPLKHNVEHGDKVAQITLASFATKDLELFSDFALRAAFYLGIPAVGPVPLPKKTKRWTVIKSPFVMAKTKENFERVTYRRQIRLYDANAEVVQVLLSVLRKYTVAGVGVKADLFTMESPEQTDQMDMPQDADAANPLAVNKVDLRSADGAVAQAVLELLKDPSFGVEPEEAAPIADKIAAQTAQAAKSTAQDSGKDGKKSAKPAKAVKTGSEKPE